jgi:hypothetical protein
MNNRIKELAEQAGFTFYGGSIWASNPDVENDFYCDEEVKKLIELIVQDCISQIAMIGVSNCDDPDVVWTVDKAIQAIKDRFK